MVDCGNSRCLQERRVFKKELLTWSKKVPLIVGLELVAEELLGKYVMTRLLEPFNDLETRDTPDWELPSTCCFCKEETTIVNDSMPQGLEDSNGASESPGMRYVQGLLPYAYRPSIIPNTVMDENKPLDLSSASPSNKSNTEYTDSPKPLVELKVPQIFTNKGKRKGDPNCKKTYTEDELQAAVTDIRSGKLGTRRAAVLYGIPRSTLRNKIFKLDNEGTPIGGSPCPDIRASQENKLSMGDLLQGVPSGFFSLPYAFTGEENHYSALSDSDWAHKLEQIRRKHNLQEVDRKFGMPSSLFNSTLLDDSNKSFRNRGHRSNPYAHELKLPFLPELVRKMAEERMMDLERCKLSQPLSLDLDLGFSAYNSHQESSSSSNSSTPVELKIPSYKPMRSYTNGVVTSGTNDDNSLSPPNISNSKIGDTLKDIIAKTIAEKVRSRAQVNNSGHSNGLSSSHQGALFENGLGKSDSSLDPPQKKVKTDSKKEQRDKKEGKTENNEPSDKASKKTRPKRGQYRKYNSQLLIEAVKAVQRGEMSVHRAGSYFGVPHSTLEYKVKERHLLRQKKPRETKSSKKSGGEEKSQASPSSSTSSTSSTNSTNSSSVTLNIPGSQASAGSAMATIASMAHHTSLGGLGFTNPFPLGLAWSQAGNGLLPLAPHDATLAAYPPSFAINTSASELLKKLQRKAQAKSSISDEERLSPLFGGKKGSNSEAAEIVAQ